MPAYIKIALVYEKAWWRENGFSGEIICFDKSPDIQSGEGISPISMVRPFLCILSHQITIFIKKLLYNF